MYYHGQTLLVRAVKEEWISPPALSFIHAHVSTVHVYHFTLRQSPEKQSLIYLDKIIVAVKCRETKIFH